MSMRDYVDLRINEHKSASSQRLEATDEKYQIQFSDSKEAVVTALSTTKEAMSKAEMVTKEAINKAEQANEKRFDTVAESITTLSNQQTKFLARTEYESAHSALAEKIDGVNDRINRNEGASGVYVTQTDLNTAIDRLQTSIESSLRPVVNFMNSQQGQQKGAGSSWAIIVTVVSLAIAAVTLITRFI